MVIGKLIQQLQQLPAWQRYVLFLGIPIALVVYSWTFFISKAREEISKLEAEKASEELSIKNIKASMDPKVIESLRQQEEKLKQELITKESELTLLVGAIPTKKDMGNVIKTLISLAGKNGVKVLSLQFREPQQTRYVLETAGDKKFVKEVQQQVQQQQPQQAQKTQSLEGVEYYKVETTMSLKGSYRGLTSFIEDLRKGGLVSYPTSISITNAEKNLINATLNIVVVMKKEEG